MKTKSDLLAIKDKELRIRVMAAIEQSGGQLTIADILRAALEEKLAHMEKSGTFTVQAKTLKLTPPRSR